ncbi:MAG: 30S ribosomal protein S8 [Clostridia bacterium]|nr:30S ribosomal protein S8 [Clostridia bacterium]
MTDPIADMLTRIRNAIMVNKDTVEIPSSNMKKAIADIMLKEGYVSDVKLVEDGYNGKLVLTLKYVGKGRSVINGLKRVSKPGLRAYAAVDTMPKVLNGLGIAVLSTNKGIMTDKQAKAANVGGEVLCYIW